jgi:REP-associated tyrosine transposase
LGFGAFSVTQSDAVVVNIRNQVQHLQKITFQDEYRRLLGRYEVGFDDKCVWD